MKSKLLITTLTLLLFSTISYAQYDRYKLNRDGSYSVGGAYDGYKMNPDGSYVCGGAYDGYKRNRDGIYSVGWENVENKKAITQCRA